MQRKEFKGGAYSKGDVFDISVNGDPLTREESLELIIKALVEPSPATLQAVRFYKGLPFKGLTFWQHLIMWWTGKYPITGRYF